MTRSMLDGVNSDAAQIAAQASGYQLVAGYVDGLYAWSDAQWALFPPGIVRVRIACFAETNDGDFLDVEQGNATPAQAPGWVTMRRNAGHPAPAVYMNTSTWPAVQQAFADQGVAEPLYIVAEYDGVAVVPVDAFGKQYADNVRLGKPWDISVIADYWPGVDPAPATASAGHTRRNDMHVDLKPNVPVVFTNPAAALGGTATMLLSCDFGDVTVRVATFSFKNNGWTVVNHALAAAGGALSLPLPADTNKVSVNVIEGNEQWPVGLDVLA